MEIHFRPADRLPSFFSQTTFTETTTSWSQTTTETSSTTSATETLTTTTTPVAHISGYFCQDTSRDGVCDSGEAPISNSTIVLTWTNGTVFETVVTNSSGMFEFTSPPYPGEVLLVQGPAGTPAATNITLDSSGSGHADVPVLPARVQGSIYYDVDNSSSLTSGDVPLNGTNVLLLLPNGTVYANLTTSSNGSFVYDTLDPVYNTNLSVVLASDPNTVLQTITTDAAGSANADVPVPVPTPVIKAQLWVDTNNNGVWDPDEVPYKAKGVYLLLPDNSTVPGTMDSLGQFSFNVSNSSLPNTPLQIYDSATNQVLSNFTTDSTSSANVAVPIPVPLTYPGVTIGSNASSNCLPTGQPYTAAVTAPLESSSNGTQSMQVDFTAGTSYTGPVKAPYGWTTEYSIDGGKTWNTTEPAPASLVTNLRTTSPKPLSSGTPSNSTNGTTYRYSSTVLVKAKPGTLAAMVNIDAYDLIFDKINDRVFFYAYVFRFYLYS